MEGGWRVDGGRMECGWRTDGGRMEDGWRVDGGDGGGIENESNMNRKWMEEG